MRQEAMDPRRERLVAFLYGELSESDARDFRKLLDSDPALALELEEMRGTRELLADWRVSEPTPSFVFVDEPSPTRRRASWWKSFFAPGTGGARGFGLGLAVAGAAAIAVSFTDFRVERVDGGLAFRFGEPRQGSTPAVAERATPSIGEPLELATNARSSTPLTTATKLATSGGDPNEVLTRAEFDKLAGQMLGSIVDLLNEYDDRQNMEMSGVLQAMYERIADRQTRESEDIRQRMNALGVELLMRQARGGRTPGHDALIPASIERNELENPRRTPDWKEEWR